MRKIYGGKNWSKLWAKLEQTGNIGIDYCINPILYPKICDQLNKIENASVIDFGAGTNILAVQFLFGYEKNITALNLCKNLDNARENVKVFTGIEQSLSLVKEAKKYHRDMGFSDKIAIQRMLLVNKNELQFDNKSVDLAISRQFLMHLSIKDLDFHFNEVARILKKDGKYVFTILNPIYELRKYRENKGNKKLENGQRYSFVHGKIGENGSFYHYFKTIEQYEKIFEKNFQIIDKKKCFPINNNFKKTHARYYWQDCPMAFVYELKKI